MEPTHKSDKKTVILDLYGVLYTKQVEPSKFYPWLAKQANIEIPKLMSSLKFSYKRQKQLQVSTLEQIDIFLGLIDLQGLFESPIQYIKKLLEFDGIQRIQQTDIETINKYSNDFEYYYLTNGKPQYIDMLIEAEVLKSFNGGTSSDMVGVSKPNLEIYKIMQSRVIEKNKENILFIDDTEANSQAGESFGWNVVRYNQSQSLNKILGNFANG